jgi:hypothetical protein
VAQDSAALCVKDVEDRATLAEREALEMVLRVEAKNAVVLASAREDAKGLVRKIALLKGKLAEERRAREVAEENSCDLSKIVADAERQWEVSERERQEQFEELSLLQIQGSEVCHAIAGPPRVRNHLCEGMQLAALSHTEMARELATLRAVVSSAAESAFGHSPDEVFHMDVVGELAAEFQKMGEQRSRLEQPTVRICNLLLGPSPSRAQLADRLDEAIG